MRFLLERNEKVSRCPTALRRKTRESTEAKSPYVLFLILSTASSVAEGLPAVLEVGGVNLFPNVVPQEWERPLGEWLRKPTSIGGVNLFPNVVPQQWLAGRGHSVSDSENLLRKLIEHPKFRCKATLQNPHPPLNTGPQANKQQGRE
jgi:hypothetical protein